MDIGDYYSKSFKGFTKNPTLAVPMFVSYILIYVIAAILGLIVVLGMLGTANLTTGQFNMTNMDYTYFGFLLLLVYGVVLIISTVISSYVSAATIGMAKKIVYGERPKLKVGLKNGNKYFIRVFLVTVIIGLIAIAVTIPFILGLIFDYMYSLSPVLTIIGGLISLILYIIVMMLFIFAYQSIVIGKKSIIGSLKESVKLLRKNLFEVVVVLIINLVILIGVGIVALFINMFLSLIPLVGAILFMLISAAIYAIVYPYFTLVLTYLYVDLKEELPAQMEYIG